MRNIAWKKLRGLRRQCFSSKMQCKANIRRRLFLFMFLLVILLKITLIKINYKLRAQWTNILWRRATRRLVGTATKMTIVLTAVRTGRPDDRTCVASIRLSSKSVPVMKPSLNSPPHLKRVDTLPLRSAFGDGTRPYTAYRHLFHAAENFVKTS